MFDQGVFFPENIPLVRPLFVNFGLSEDELPYSEDGTGRGMGAVCSRGGGYAHAPFITVDTEPGLWMLDQVFGGWVRFW